MGCGCTYTCTALLLCILLASSSTYAEYSQQQQTHSKFELHRPFTSPGTLKHSPSHVVSRINHPSPSPHISSSPSIQNSTPSPSPSPAPTAHASNTTEIEICLDCISFMQNNLNSLIQIVEKIGVTDTCDKICGMLNSTIDIDACNVMCTAIGSNNFWELFVKVDINPIYACELVNACVAGKDPVVKFTTYSITPPSGPPGTTFEFKMQFTVVNETGVGETAFVIYYPSENDYSVGFISQQIFPDYLPGDYQANLTFPTNATFMAGKYLVIFDLCSGACGLDPDVYPFATEQITFNITNIGS